MCMNVILLGPPGSGKGTQAAQVSQRLSLFHLSTGDIFRQQIQVGSALGNQARAYVNRGEYVPDSISIAIVREELLKPRAFHGIVFDGFPRTVQQAEALHQMLSGLREQVDTAIKLTVSADEITGRAEGG